MTYSDVITLLMTFFILLLTFATDQPEKFERLQTAMFGGGGGTGIAGESHGAVERDAVLLRQRPRSGRLTIRGSEMPPLYSDASLESLAQGIEGLEDSDEVDAMDAHSIYIPIALLVDGNGQITGLGQHYLRMLARQLRKLPYDVTFQLARRPDVSKAMALAQHLMKVESVRPGSIGVGLLTLQDASGRSVRIDLIRRRKE